MFENTEADYYKTFPFSIEEQVKAHNGTFLYSDKSRANFYLVDGRFITGQDSSSTISVAQNIVAVIKKQTN